jgi:hypothetical protein
MRHNRVEFEFGDDEMTNQQTAQLMSGSSSMISAVTELHGWEDTIPKIVGQWAWLDHLAVLEDINFQRTL